MIGLGNVNSTMASHGVFQVWIANFKTGGDDDTRKLIPKTLAQHKLLEGHLILTKEFWQNWRTVKNINTHFKGDVR